MALQSHCNPAFLGLRKQWQGQQKPRQLVENLAGQNGSKNKKGDDAAMPPPPPRRHCYFHIEVTVFLKLHLKFGF
jgi:hypothetical protein